METVATVGLIASDGGCMDRLVELFGGSSKKPCIWFRSSQSQEQDRCLCLLIKGPPIDDVHMEGSGSGGRMWTGEGVQPHVDVHTEN